VKPIGLSFGSVSDWPAAGAIAAIAFVAVQAGRKRQNRTRAMLTGIGAGLVIGIQDALTRQTLQILQSNGISALFTTWAPYALVGAGATGIWLMQNAFSAGPLQASLPAISAGEPLVGIFLGVLVFGDRIQITPGMLAIQASGIAALIVGVILVGRAPALTQLRSLTPSSIPQAISDGLHGRRPTDQEDQPLTEKPATGQSPTGQSPNGQFPNAQPPGSQSLTGQLQSSVPADGQPADDHPAHDQAAQKSQPRYARFSAPLGRLRHRPE
jgi:hypothetical protein